MTNETNHNPETTKPRWFRFRLRTLLVMVTFISVPLGWVGWELDQRRREKAAIAWVEEMGGQAFSLPNDQRSWWGKTKDKCFGQKIRVVNLTDAYVSDVSPLSELKNLEELYLQWTQVSDLSPLAELKNLTTLYLTVTQVSDLSPLAELKNLERLTLSATEMNDLSPLAELKNLKLLDLSTTKLGDLSPMAELKNLDRLYLYNTTVSEEQVEELRLALPNCKIRH